MKHAEGLQRELQAAIGELRSTRAKVAELGDENNRLVEETKQVSISCSFDPTAYIGVICTSL